MKIAAILALATLLAAPAATASGIAGQWDWISHTGGGDRPGSAEFQLNGETVTGKWLGADVKGTFAGNHLKLSFPFTSPEANLSATLELDGKLDGDTLKGTWTFGEHTGAFTATRKKSSTVAGNWQCEIQTDRTIEAVLSISDAAGALSGKIKAHDREVAILSPKFENGVLTFQVETGSTTVSFRITPEGDTLSGTWNAGNGSGPLKGKRVPA